MYIGPDALMPLASAVAAVFGFVLMFWKRLVEGVKYLFRRGGSDDVKPGSTPGTE